MSDTAVKSVTIGADEVPPSYYAANLVFLLCRLKIVNVHSA